MPRQLKFSPASIEYQNQFFLSPKRYVFAIGGMGSGKSFGLCLRCLATGLAHSKAVLVVMRKTFSQLKRSTLHTFFEKMLGVDWTDEAAVKSLPFVRDFNKTDLRLTLTNGSVIWFASAGGVGSSEGIRGMEIDQLFLDEIIEMEEPILSWGISRLRGTCGAPRQIFGVGNPAGKSHWFYQRFVLSSAPEVDYFPSRARDNPFLPAGYCEGIETSPDVNYKRRMLEGEWVNFEGMVFPEFDQDRHVVKATTEPDRHLCFSLDYGYNHPTVMLKLGTLGDMVFVYDELYARSKTVDELGKLFRKFGVSNQALIYHDPSMNARSGITGTSPIKVLQDQGYRGFRNADNSRLPGIDLIKTLLLNNRLMISEKCVTLILQLQSLAWEKVSRNSEELTDKPEKKDDDATDTLRYGVTSYEVSEFLDGRDPSQRVVTNTAALDRAEMHRRWRERR